MTDASPLVKTRALRCSSDHAFDVYVDRIGEWWPVDEFSVYNGTGLSVVIEGRVGGRIVETGPGGEESVWGTLTDWAPKSGLAHSWHPGQEPSAATRVELTFAPTEHGCEVRLVHTGWDEPGVMASREGYDEGWDLVLGRYHAAVG